MVCAVDRRAAEAGAEIVRAGGNAADAAVAASAVLAVTTPHMCGMGGDLFALVSVPGESVPLALNASGRAGSGADPDRLRGEGATAMPYRGDIRSVPVPGCVDGWLALHERCGRLPLRSVLEPAIDAARNGFAASPLLVWSARAVQAAAWPGTDPSARVTESGERVTRPGVARSLEAILAGGRASFYEGEFGSGLLALGEGEYQPGDLTEPLADWPVPLSVGAFGQTIWTTPPNSQGYITLLSAAIADGLALPRDPDDPAWAHLLIESSRAAAYDRMSVLHQDADVAPLLTPTEVERRRSLVAIERAGSAGVPARGGGTIFLCAVDKDRMGVSLIQSNASGFGCGIVEPTTGIYLQNRGIGFSLEPGHPAEYGPRRRPPHTLSPAVVTDGSGRLRMVVGSMGGDSQPQIVLQLLARLLLRGQQPGDAIDAGRFAFEAVAPGPHPGFDVWDGGRANRIVLEATAPPRWDAGLAGRGHDVVRAAAGRNFGHAHVITVDGDGLAGASDPRALIGAAVAA